MVTKTKGLMADEKLRAAGEQAVQTLKAEDWAKESYAAGEQPRSYSEKMRAEILEAESKGVAAKDLVVGRPDEAYCYGGDEARRRIRRVVEGGIGWRGFLRGLVE